MTSRARFAHLLLCGAAITLCGCGVQLKEDAEDALDDVADEVPDDVADVNLDVKVCGDQTLSDLLSGDSISDECRDKVESFLPAPQSSFESRLVVLGESREASGARTLYVIGADAEGDALFTATPSEVAVSVTVDGELRAIAEADVSVELPLDGDLLSIGVVNDYSASMRDEDLAVVSEIENDLFSLMPPIYEGEVTQFSDMVDVVQAFTADDAALLGAVDIDAEYERGSTALYDGMGVALDSLVARERPARVLLVSTDGAENASMQYMEDALLATIEEQRVVVIMLGALFADVDGLKRLAGDRGIYVYARGYGRLKTAVQGLIDSLGHMAAVHLPPEADDAESVTLALDGQSLTVPLQP